MTLLNTIDHKPGLRKDGIIVRRTAVRAIIQEGRRLLLIHSTESGDYKFPGGGVEPGETHAQALTREVQEECGATLTGEMIPFGQMIENDRPLEPEADLFQMTSSYYRCQVTAELNAQRLDDYEQDLGFRPVWIDIDAAIQHNQALLRDKPPGLPRWVRRDTEVLERVRSVMDLASEETQ